MWGNCEFFLYTNILLQFYRLSEQSARQLLDILQTIKERLWIPNHVVKEFFTNRLEVMADQEKAYAEIAEIVNVRDKIAKYRKHITIDVESILSILIESEKKIKLVINEAKQAHLNYIEEDSKLKELLDLLNGKVGLPYEKNRLSELIKAGEPRLSKKIPPGYT